jgi:hypothetical protein
MKEDFLVFQKMYDYMVYAFPVIAMMPKNHRFVLGQQIEVHMLEILSLLIVVNKLDVSERKPYFVKFSNMFDVMGVKIRLANDLKLMYIKQYLNMAEMSNEVIRLTYNWLH